MIADSRPRHLVPRSQNFEGTMTVAGRLTIVLVVAVMAGIGSAAAITYHAGTRINAALEQARVSHLLGSLHTTVETNLSIGLGLDQLSTMQPQIERERAADPSVLAIDVFAADGRPLYSTDSGALDEPVPDAWTAQLATAGLWRLVQRDETVFGLRFENNIGETAGALAVTVSDEQQTGRSRQWAMTLGWKLLALIVITTVLAIIATRLFARRLTVPFRQVAAILDGEPTPATSPLTRAAAAVREQWQRREAAIEAGMQQLKEMDDVG